MNNINQFLKSQINIFSKDATKVDVTDRDIKNIHALFLSKSKSFHQTRHLKIKPWVQKGQIWTIKNQYDDFESLSQKTSHPFIVLVNNDPNDIEGEGFVRVFVISPFIEMASSVDEVCYDASIIGFPFLIETWNDQPLLTEILDEYIGYYELKSKTFAKSEAFELVNEPITDYLKAASEILLEAQQEFRDIEISRAKYINHSVLSLLSFLENRQSQDAGVVISIFGKTEYPKFYIDQTQNEPTLALAAKSGIDGEDKYLLLDNESLPFKIFIRKNEDGFVLSVYTADNLKLITNHNEEITGISNNEKTVFAKLQAGKYTLISEQVKESIKIRLK